MKDYETMMAQLEQILGRLENGKLPLDESVTTFEEGMKLVKECQALLEQARGKVEKIIHDDGQREILVAQEDDDDQP